MYYDKTNSGYILRIRVTPNSSVFCISGIFTDSNLQDFLKINLNSVPQKGKANIELIKHLSKILKISKSSFSIVCGETDRYKKIELNISHSEELEEKLNSLGV
ncbi:MAG: DUF167 domain-containing protein [Alphaproteobacteria bacterium]|nr:DUF167 domain-containing protein [Alphaproteobacteria bacterium]